MATKKDWAPTQHPIRDPRSTKKNSGRVKNPPRAVQLGGVGEAQLWKAGSPDDLKVSDRGTKGKK